jgi:hypothetical protein
MLRTRSGRWGGLALLFLLAFTGVARAEGEAAPTKAPEKVDQAVKKEADRASKDVAPAEKPAFVDRDGDGIQDGQEHRFRHKRGGKGHGSGTEGTGKQTRYHGGQDSDGHGKGGQP